MTISHDYRCVLYTCSLVEVRVENEVAQILCELGRMSREQLLFFSKHDLRDFTLYLETSCTPIDLTNKSHRNIETSVSVLPVKWVCPSSH